MKRLLLAGIATAALIASASAADIAKPVYKAAVAVPVYGWTGFYVGGNVGYGVARNPSSSTYSSSRGETFNLAPHGVFGGGQVGYNWQAAPNWVFGIEADIQTSDQTDATTCVNLCNAPFVYTQVSQKLSWFGTLRGRVGWTNGPTLFYVTGGKAYGEVSTEYSISNAPGTDAHSFSHTRSGWTVGGGVETQLAGNWTAKAEYLYIDLGNLADVFIYAPDPTTSLVNTSHIRNHVARLGLNYKFGAPVSAVAGGFSNAPAAATFNWSGLYLGGNVGYGVARDPSSSTIFSGAPAVSADTFNLSPRGVLGGGQIGYNWQTAPNWVFGIEADIQASAQKDSTTCVRFCQSLLITEPTQKLPWFGTLRGRLGWTNGPALFYATGGLAFGEVTTDYVITTLPSVVVRQSFSHTKVGWTVGGGIEAQLAGNWTAKLEYLHVDLGSVNDSFGYPPNPFVTFVESSSVRNHVARVGLNYKFGHTPIVAKY